MVVELRSSTNESLVLMFDFCILNFLTFDWASALDIVVAGIFYMNPVP
jgi:hypothetical protein